ncbi:type IV pili methyl-accepting chemotaxis transducer N-terminal domain-containing protein [Marinobacterium jannaschii]|uniref:type IV pili methyl-accepting chemotaxis transducer N-terminal domain-containing protein n=1 Tax=Marinobacterium jannaschii TaxID=64970 RepID=UPI00048501B8|nr:type IV pili methyl-accepting chemotaxis transducer N-terminal domain-containing protein [Marinobacterium jannaschii]
MKIMNFLKTILPVIALGSLMSTASVAGITSFDGQGGNQKQSTTANATPQQPLASADEAIASASELRMLTQRMYKDYIFAGLNVRARRARQDLKQAMALFETELARITLFAHNDNLKTRATELKDAWLSIKPIYSKSPDKGRVAELRDLNIALLKASHTNVTTLMVFGGSRFGRMVNLAGEQTMLSQRMAALYGLMAWGFEKEFEDIYNIVEKDFGYNLEVMMDHPINTSRVDRKLKKVKRQFASFGRSSKNGSRTYVPALIDRSAEKMLEEMLDVTNLYADLSSN